MRLATWDCVQQAALLAFPQSAGGAAPPPALPTLTSRNTDYQRCRKKQDCQGPKATLECAGGAGWLPPFWNRTHGSPGAPLSLSEPLPGMSSYSLSSAPSTQLTPAYSPVSGWTNHWAHKQLPLPSGPHQAGSLQEKPHPRKGQLPNSTVPFLSHVKGRCRFRLSSYRHTTLTEPPCDVPTVSRLALAQPRSHQGPADPPSATRHSFLQALPALLTTPLQAGP